MLGHPEYYPRSGVVRSSAQGIRLAFEVDDAAMMVLGLVPGRELPGGTIRYAAPFGV